MVPAFQKEFVPLSHTFVFWDIGLPERRKKYCPTNCPIVFLDIEVTLGMELVEWNRLFVLISKVMYIFNSNYNVPRGAGCQGLSLDTIRLLKLILNIQCIKERYKKNIDTLREGFKKKPLNL